MACGGHHIVGVNQEGDLVSWGNGDFGQLGHGRKHDGWNHHKYHITEPKIMELALCSKKVQHVTCGNYHTCVLTTEGEVYSWYVGKNAVAKSKKK